MKFDIVCASKILTFGSLVSFAALAWKVHIQEVPKIYEKLTDSSAKALKAFHKMYHTYANPQFLLVIVSTLSSGFLAYKTKDRRWLAVMVSSAYPAVFTLGWLGPQVNQKLFALKDRSDAGEAIETEEVKSLFGKWKLGHLSRAVVSTVGVIALYSIRPFAKKHCH